MVHKQPHLRFEVAEHVVGEHSSPRLIGYSWVMALCDLGARDSDCECERVFD
jgi:hypothetical protein